jgi:2-keto-4-pentenoate hydratase/2-oxohepta-3-ene-1,7-dioic acid hydratase in catechol pathway
VQELKVCRYDAGAGARLGSVVADRVYDLERCGATGREAQSTALADFLAGGSAALAAARQALARVLQAGSTEGPSGETLAYPLESVSLRAPIVPSTKVICMGRTFESHVVIGGLEPHPKPTPFYKLTQVVVGPDEYVVLPKHHYPEPVVYGTELTVVIGKEGRSISEDRAAEHIWGYTVLNDVTMRGAYQTVAKSFDTSAPVGPWIVPQDQIGDPHNLQLTFRLNGEQVQAGSTRDLRFTVPAMVAESSKWVTLQPGDIIATGDVGATVPLRPGDLMEAEVESIGVLRNPVRLEE